ncbi:hypothetical protein L7F22_035105, partial [Adiantum nelumboides]|nr:hypothetical protein [Adiantum nelumboides]
IINWGHLDEIILSVLYGSWKQGHMVLGGRSHGKAGSSGMKSRKLFSPPRPTVSLQLLT